MTDHIDYAALAAADMRRAEQCDARIAALPASTSAFFRSNLIARAASWRGKAEECQRKHRAGVKTLTIDAIERLRATRI